MSKLGDLVSGFGTKEWKGLLNYVQSGLTGRNKTTESILNLARKTAKSGHRLRSNDFNYNALSDAYSKCLEFCGFNVYQKDTHYQIYSQLLYLYQEKKWNLFEKEFKKAEKHFDDIQTISEEGYYWSFRLRQLQDDALMERQSRNVVDSINDSNEALDTYFIIRKLKMSCEMLNRSRLLNISIDLHLLEPLLQYIGSRKDHFFQVPVVWLYYLLSKQLLTIQDPQYFTEIKSILHQKFKEIPDAKSVYTHLQNVCIVQINHGNSVYVNELFELYADQIENEILFQRGFLSQWDYKTIITLGLRLDKKEWTLQFIENYKNQLPEFLAENAYNYNKANYLYEIGSFKEALQNLRQVQFTDVFYKLSARALLLKIYFRLQDWEGLDHSLATFASLLKRDKSIPSTQSDAYQIFIDLVKKGSRIMQKRDFWSEKKFNDAREKLFAEISEKGESANLRWLLELVG